MSEFPGVSACVSLEASFESIEDAVFYSNPDRQALSWTLPMELLRLGPEWDKAALSRRQEFCAGRACAAMALQRLGAADLVVGRARDRRPIWPQGFVGSISHTRDFAIAAVTSTQAASSLGIDAERTISPLLRLEIEARILSASEVLLAPSELSAEEFLTLVFAAKEATYKTLNPLDNVFRDFRDLELKELHPTGLFKVFDRKSTQSLYGKWKKFADLFVCEVSLAPKATLQIADIF